jgi:hypothetical protein
VVLRWGSDRVPATQEVLVEIGFLAPELVVDRLVPGLSFRLMEGRRRVGKVSVIEVLT